jgi:DNA-directed RNA polymerase specialized sigma subunit
MTGNQMNTFTQPEMEYLCHQILNGTRTTVKSRKVLEYTYVDCLSTKQIAKKMNVSTGRIWEIQRNNRRWIQQRLIALNLRPDYRYD